MGLAVTTVAAGGLPVKELAGGGIAVTEVASYGLAVTKVTGTGAGMGVTFVSATGGPAVTYATFDPATATAVTLSGGNLVVTNTGGAATDQGARVVATAGKTSGKIYFEITYTTIVGTGLQGVNVGAGIATTSSTYTGFGNNATTGVGYYKARSVWANGSNVVASSTQFPNGTVLGISVDLTNRKIWFREGAAGNWNFSGSNNPETNVGGYTVPAGTMVPIITYGGSGGQNGTIVTANFGASAFVGAVPSGFTAGWRA